MSCIETATTSLKASLKRKKGQSSRKKRRKNTRTAKSSGLLPTYQNNLPVEVLQHIFSFLPIRYLLSAQFVCHLWQDVAVTKDFWKGFSLDITDLPNEELEYRLSVLPGLRDIRGHTQGAYFNYMLKCINELTKMNCSFDPPLSSIQLKKLLGKYPNIESLVLDIRSDDIVKSVEMLKEKCYLKELIFYCPCADTFDSKVVYHHSCVPMPVNEKYVKIFNLLKNGFTNLEHLDISPFACEYVFHDKIIKEAVTTALIEKCKKLLTLKVPHIESNMNEAVLLAIQRTTRVKRIVQVNEHGIFKYILS